MIKEVTCGTGRPPNLDSTSNSTTGSLTKSQEILLIKIGVKTKF